MVIGVMNVCTYCKLSLKNSASALRDYRTTLLKQSNFIINPCSTPHEIYSEEYFYRDLVS